MKKLKPSVVFVRGGFVGVPVGLAAAMRHVPYITHDSDSIPSLANRLIGRWASIYAVALPKEVYDYPADKTVTVGVPINANFQLVNNELQTRYRQELKIPASAPVICVTGGGLGAQRLNEAVVAAAPELFKHYPKLWILHLTGRQHEVDIQKWYDKQVEAKFHEQVIVKGFVDDFYRFSGAADVIVCRAGATNLAEFAQQGKACILVPNPHLTAGHQLKNAQLLAQAGAAAVLPEDKLAQPLELVAAISELLEAETKRTSLGKVLHGFAKPQAAAELADLIITVAKQQEFRR